MSEKAESMLFEKHEKLEHLQELEAALKKANERVGELEEYLTDTYFRNWRHDFKDWKSEQS